MGAMAKMELHITAGRGHGYCQTSNVDKLCQGLRIGSLISMGGGVMTAAGFDMVGN
jgi:hypothetical protein